MTCVLTPTTGSPRPAALPTTASPSPPGRPSARRQSCRLARPATQMELWVHLLLDSLWPGVSSLWAPVHLVWSAWTECARRPRQTALTPSTLTASATPLMSGWGNVLNEILELPTSSCQDYNQELDLYFSVQLRLAAGQHTAWSPQTTQTASVWISPLLKIFPAETLRPR